jgi:hypothetical protein
LGCLVGFYPIRALITSIALANIYGCLPQSLPVPALAGISIQTPNAHPDAAPGAPVSDPACSGTIETRAGSEIGAPNAVRFGAVSRACCRKQVGRCRESGTRSRPRPRRRNTQ